MRHIIIEGIESLLEQDFQDFYRSYFKRDFSKDPYSPEVDALVGRAMSNLISALKPTTLALVDKLLDGVELTEPIIDIKESGEFDG
ncbi:hypothetical protein GIY09_09375 [Aerococcaceae bacterium WS4759]|uniref:Uncharacterized protein n=1 Tax=Fundicoccus ignavus TaxID=2664442 RepID=A0A6I2GJS0_9LACT|nr:hypothetical protein [Fundicoccus ignavus]MRI86072.1 hypothetical protein [Fundicoccus ignavus]